MWKLLLAIVMCICCVFAVPEYCSLPAVTGPCRGAFSNWYFDSSTNTCKEFIYGGCKGNQNNFKTEDACKDTCGSGSCDE